MRPAVSVIIPTFDRAQDVCRAVDSCLEQTYDPIEIIVVDDGSTDETAAVLSRYGNKIRYRALAHSGLPARARNAGLEIAGGEYVAFLDSDDRWSPEKIAVQADILDKSEDVGLVCANALVDSENDRHGVPYLQPGQGRSGWLLKDLLEDNFIITSTVIVRRSVLNRAGGFHETPLLRGIEDFDLWLRVAAISKVFFIDDPLAVYRDAPASIRSQQSPAAYWQGMLYILEGLRRDRGDKQSGDGELGILINKLIFAYQRRLFSAHLNAKEYLDAVKCVWRLIKQFPTANPTTSPGN